MNSPLPNAVHFLTEDGSVVGKTNEMSPVTNLALNMESLTTSFTGTPNRRISWSNPYPDENGTKKLIDGFSPCIDSPMFQENFCKSKSKLKTHKVSRKVLSSSEDDKENLAPQMNLDLGAMKRKSESDNMFESDSQDSGYSDMCMQHFGITAIDSTPRIRSKSSVFTDDEEDEFENLIQMEEDEGDQEIIHMPDIKSLLTKPLHNDMEFKNASDMAKVGKLPIRRCLSMEMECTSDSKFSKLEMVSKTGTFIASPNVQNDPSTNLNPPPKCPFKRPDPPNYHPLQNKRRKSSPSVTLCKEITEESNFTFQRSFSETAATIMHAVLKADLQPDLIGDCSRYYILPLVKGRHQDLKCISPQTLAQVIKGEYSDEIDNYTLVDCRYPYEFEGGHIQGAQNIFTKEDILENFLKEITTVPTSGRNIIIFHCEFSSERAPNLCRFLRNKDREINEDNYPKLHHPEMYLLEGGYKAFFQDYKEYCEPQDYKPMNHKDHGFELRHFRAKSKSWGADSKSRLKLKSRATEKL